MAADDAQVQQVGGHVPWGATAVCRCCGCWMEAPGLCMGCWTHERDGLVCDQDTEQTPTPCPGAVDYGHHGRDRCVWCGIEREPAAGQENR